MCCINRASASLLCRKKQQRRIEGTRTRPPWHRRKNARVECTAGEHTLLHSSFLFCICDHVRAAAVPYSPFSSAAPRSPCVACPIHGLLGLLLRSSGAVGSAIEVTAAQDFERPRLSYHNQVSTLCSALVYRASQNVIRGPIFSSCLRQ